MTLTSFHRKVIYIGAVAVLLVPLSMLGQPRAVDRSGMIQGGGELARLRHEYNLSQADLGEIDPAGEAIQVASLGLHGIAANILWEQANEYKKKEDWENLRASVNQITKLQPNYVAVWEFQGHNLAYNVSVEFDNYQHRYHWVKKGLGFLADGIRYNRDNPRLLHFIGWVYGHKIGRSDEQLQFRRMFNVDHDFHEEIVRHIPQVKELACRGPKGPDNWLVSYQWYLKAEEAVDLKGRRPKGSPVVFFSDSPMALVNYAVSLEKDGYLDDRARIAWQKASEVMKSLGDRQIETSWGFDIRLNDLDHYAAERERLLKKLESFEEGVRDRLRQEILASLPADQKQALDVPAEKRTQEQIVLAGEAEAKLKITPVMIGEAVMKTAKTTAEARSLVQEMLEADTQHGVIDRYRDTINYTYWRMRCEVEQEDAALRGRQFLYEAKRLKNEAKLVDAYKKYEAAWAEWIQIYKKYPATEEDVTAAELVEDIDR